MNSPVCLQAYIRGWNVRENYVLPHQILPAIQKNLQGYHSDQHFDIARVICIALRSKRLQERNVVEKESKKNAYILKLPDTLSRCLDRPFHLILKKVKRTFHVVIQHCGKFSVLGNILDRGNYKVICRAQTFIFSPSHDNNPSLASHKFQVVIFSKDEDTLSVLRIHRKILKIGLGHFADLPMLISSNDTTFKMIQNWYNANLFSATQKKAVPIDFMGTMTIPFTMKDILKVLVDVARSLEYQHGQGIVHRDIKMKNILIKLNDDLKVMGYITDFDVTQSFGLSDTRENYRYWDCLSRLGIILPTSDIFGLAITLGESLIPTFEIDGLSDYPSLLSEESNFNQWRNRALTWHAFEAMGTIYNDLKTLSRSELENMLASHPRLEEIKIEFNVIEESMKLIQDIFHKNLNLEKKLTPHTLKRYLEVAKKSPKNFYQREIMPYHVSTPYVRVRLEEILALFG